MILKALTTWIVMAVLEVFQGVLRVRLLNRRLGDQRARQFGVISGSIVNFAVVWLMWPWLGAQSALELWGLGLFWFGLTLMFDLAIGRWFFRFAWNRIAREFNPRSGGWLGGGMLLLLGSPWCAFWLYN